MRSILHEFYFGNIHPNEKSFVRESEFGKLCETLSESEGKLLKLLNGVEKELFETFSKAQGDLNMLSVADGFVDGFCLGMRIAVEVMEKQY